MIVKDFLNVLNMQVKYKVTDRRTKEELKLTLDNGRVNHETIDRNVYMVFQEDDTLNITVY